MSVLSTMIYETTAMGPTMARQPADLHGAASIAAGKVHPRLLRLELRKDLDPCARAVTAALVVNACSLFAST